MSKTGGIVKDCRDCEKHSWPKDCVGKEFYTYRDICWCRWQIPWLILNLSADKWPPNPEGSGYTDPQIKTGYASEGHFVKPASILGELNYRLDRCKVDGKLLRAEILAGLELSQESRDALNYCLGFNRKRKSYTDWKKQRKYRREGHQKVSLKREVPK